ncbi:hypothetical protein H5999_12055, partial [[Clostridium] spiroforme]|nr:hypothetical protein [Thomasclavelia spiroformis]
ASFKNQYKATGTLEGDKDLSFSKILSGRDWKEGDSFEFTISGKDGAPMPTEEKVTLSYDKDHSQKNGENVGGAFGDISYDQGDIGKTYVYTISETKGTIAGVTYSKEEYKVEVSVSDAGNGQLQIDKKVTKDGEDV